MTRNGTKKGFAFTAGASVRRVICAMVFLFAVASGTAQQMVSHSAAAEVWRDAGVLRDPARREAVTSRLRTIHQVRKARAVQEARLRGLPIHEMRPDGGIIELMDWLDDKPLYYTTLNASAAISTGANLVRAAPYSVDGSGWTVGVWDGGGVRTNHQEFGGRVTIKDGGYTNVISHATHVAGTIAAAGVVSTAMGMAPDVNLDSYDWDNDDSESASRGAAYGGEPGKIYLSNHSYSYVAGWYNTGSSSPRYVWYGTHTTTNGHDSYFGQYNEYVSEIDGRLHGLPYYLTVWAAGNDRGDNPVNGNNVALSPDGAVVVYDSALHPPGDGKYKGGYDTLGFFAGAKNVLAVGAVGDAVTSGQRDLSKALMTSFSSWGPTDDGRIKPDLVANGVVLYSTDSDSNTDYTYKSGTSMAAPNATGTAQLLLSLYTSLKPGEYLRASTLKGLLIHTADDLGTPGPDYTFGWGLINAKDAADLISTAATNPAVASILESQITPASSVQEYAFNWDGVSPIRATLSWTDPAGPTTSGHDSRASRLVNNLNLQLVSPNSDVHLPFVMPFVGTWTTASMSAAATTGTNNTDNIEQVFVASPAVPGVWKAVVTYSGTLAGNLQDYSLIISGAKPMPPAPLFVDPDYVVFAEIPVSIVGSDFSSEADVTFFRSGHSDVSASVHNVSPSGISCTPDLTRMAQGLWSVRVENEDGQFGTLTHALSVVKALALADFEEAPSGWMASANLGSTYWSRVTTASHTPSYSYFTHGPATRNTDNLTSPVYAIPANATDIRLRFWHRYNTETRDGCVLEVLPGGEVNWLEIGAVGSGASFVKGGYTTTITQNIGLPLNKAELVGRPAWTGDSGPNFTEVVVALDPDVYAGLTLRARWRLSTNSDTTSTGWWVDTFGVYAFSSSTRTLFILK